MAKKRHSRDQSHQAGERIIAATLKDIKDGKNDPKLGWPGCGKFFPPR